MKLIFFIDPMSYGNLAVYDYNLLKYNNSHDVFFFGSAYYDYKKISSPTQFFPFFTYNKKKNKLSKVLSYIHSILYLSYLSFKHKPNIVHIQWIRLWAIDILFLIFLKLLKVKVVYTAHNVLPHESKKRTWIQYKYYYKILTTIIVHTEESKSKLVDLFSIDPLKISVIPHGLLDLCKDRGQVELMKKEINEKLKLDNKIVFSILGLQSFYKGSDLVCKLWAENEELHDSKYQLLFWGKNNNINTSAIKNIHNVSIVNRYLSNEEFLAAIQLTSVLLMPYRVISQSGVLLTAINESIPFLVSSAGSLKEPLDFANVGWYMGEANYENLQDSVVNIIRNESEIYNFKNNKEGWMVLQNKFSWDKISNNTFQLYSTI